MRDLEIRGAGNLLGTEQSGHVAIIGFELYCRLLRAAVSRMKKGGWRPPPTVQMRLDFLTLRAAEVGDGMAGAYVPAGYIPEVRERIEAYRLAAEAGWKSGRPRSLGMIREGISPLSKRTSAWPEE